MVLDSLWQALEASPVAAFVAGSDWAFPTLESIHVIAIVTVVGSIAVMDFRLLGIASKDAAVTQMARDTLPLTWTAFVLAAITGGLLFCSKATNYAANPYFIAKMIFLVCAGINQGIFHHFAWKGVHAWDKDTVIPRAGKIAGALSLTFWLLVIFCGRVIGFTLGIYE